MNQIPPPKFTNYELWCGRAMEHRVGITVIYASLSRPSGKYPYTLDWEEELQIQWSMETWQSALATTYKDIINTSLLQANIKIVSRWSQTSQNFSIVQNLMY